MTTTLRTSIGSIRWRLEGRRLPLLMHAVVLGEVMRSAAIGAARAVLGADRIPPELSGHGEDGDWRVPHAFCLAEDSLDTGRVDHLLLHLAGGLAAESLMALGAFCPIFPEELADCRALSPVPAGAGGNPDSVLVGPSAAWVSMTPFRHPWHARATLRQEDQIRRCCRLAGLPEPLTAERLEHRVIGGVPLRPVDFIGWRTPPLRAPIDRRGSFWRIVFPEPVHGPVALGYARHFGLGLFRTEDTRR